MAARQSADRGRSRSGKEAMWGAGIVLPSGARAQRRFSRLPPLAENDRVAGAVGHPRWGRRLFWRMTSLGAGAPPLARAARSFRAAFMGRSPILCLLGLAAFLFIAPLLSQLRVAFHPALLEKVHEMSCLSPSDRAPPSQLRARRRPALGGWPAAARRLLDLPVVRAVSRGTWDSPRASGAGPARAAPRGPRDRGGSPIPHA